MAPKWVMKHFHSRLLYIFTEEKAVFFFFLKQIKLEKRIIHAVWTLYAESHMQSINTDVWWGGRQSEEHACAKKKKELN